MIRMIQRRLIIPRGDTGSFSIPYLKAINPGDVAVFTIFDIRTKTKMYQKLIAAEGDILNIAFTHGDTVNLKPGKYLWDIKFYTNPRIVDDELVDGDEVDSYYAGFSLPECEIRETGDALLTSDDAPTSTISPESLNIINAAINEILNTKRITVEAAETASLKADVAVASAENASNSAAAASQSATIAEARVNEIENLSVEVDTGLEGTDASVTYTPSTGVLSFEIPRGNTGNGIASCVLNADFTLTINYTDGTSMTTVPIRGDTPHFTIGQVTEGPNAIATITGTDANPILNLTLPNANVPTRVSQLENDAGYLTEHQDLSDYVQKTDYATADNAGVVKIDSSYGIQISSNGYLQTSAPSNSQIKSANKTAGTYRPIVPSVQHISAFYGLAKAAGDTTQSQSSNAVGAYTDEAKAAIQQMLDVPSTSDIPNVPVQDVQINGASIVNNNVAEIPIAQYSSGQATLGLVKSYGLGINIDSNGEVSIKKASDSQMKRGSGDTAPIVASQQHQSVFYGLAKAAGDTTQSQSSNAVGTYTDEAKTAIQQMLDVPSTSDIPTQVSAFTNDAGYLTTETDPTVPAWAKAAQKPSYTAAEVGAPTVAEMNTAIGTAIGQINSFDLAAVQELPTQDISTHTIYLVPKTGETNDVYDEYVYINDNWEMVGNTQIDLSDYVQKTDYATAKSAGVVKISGAMGIDMTNGFLTMSTADHAYIQDGTHARKAITPKFQHESAFYGLAKAAGDSTQSQSSNAVGTYTDEAKAAIQQMLDVPSNSDIPDVSVYATKTDTMLETTLSRGRKEGTTIGTGSLAFGNDVESSSTYTIAFGHKTSATGPNSYSEGNQTLASGNASHAEGFKSIATGAGSHAEGSNTIANAAYSHVEGKYNIEDSIQSWPTWTPNTEYAVGDKVKMLVVNLNNETSFSGYICKIANNDAEFITANWTKTTFMNYPYIIGNGTADNARSNAYALDWDGNGHYAGDVYVHANADSTGGTKLATIEDIPDAPVQDVQVNGVSVLQDGVANVPCLKGDPGADYILTAADKAEIAAAAVALIHKTLTVTVLTQDGVTVTGQTVYVRADNASGEVYATAAYEGQPVSFSVPDGFQYYVSVSDTLNHHFNPTTASGIVSNTDIAVTLQYSDFSSIRTAADIKAALNAGMDLTDLVGEQITCAKGSDTLTWDVVDYDETNKNVTLLLHDVFGTANMQFEPVQALMWCENGLAVGSYTFTWQNAQCYFTLTTAIPAGGQLRATNSQFQTYASQDATATLETGTVGTEEITGATDLGHEGQGLLNHRDCVNYGSNNFAESALFWWLNSDAAANTPRVPVTKFSRAYSYAQPGFMNGLDVDFVNCLDEVDWLCSTNNVYECPESLGGYTKGTQQAYTVKAKFGLASEMEIFGSYGGNADGSKVFDLYSDATADERKKYRGTSAQVWWLRSPYWDSASRERTVHSSGSAIHYHATSSYGVVPACRISRTAE